LVETKEVAIPREIHDKLQESLAASGSTSVDELAGRILRDWLTMREASSRGPPRKRITKADEKTVEERLKALGYV